MVKKEGEGGNKEEGIWFITVEVTNMPPLTMKVKPKTKISKLVEVFSTRNNIDRKAARWLNPDGQRVELDRSLEENGFEDGDKLEGRVGQEGGEGGFQRDISHL